MKLAENAYAIQPGNFHNWQEEEIYARDAALESFEAGWTASLISDERCKVFEKIDNVMTEATQALYDAPAKSEKFHRLLFAVWANGPACIREMQEMLEEEIGAVMREEFSRGTDRH